MLRIEKAAPGMLPRLMELYDGGRRFMRSVGNMNQWTGGFPRRELIEDDIRRGKLYVCLDGDAVVGVFYFDVAPDKTYGVIDGEWLDGDEYGVIHRITTDRSTHGVGTFCIEWALARCGNVRIDTHEDNAPMRHLLGKLGFTECGVIYLENGDPRVAYQKHIPAGGVVSPDGERSGK